MTAGQGFVAEVPSGEAGRRLLVVGEFDISNTAILERALAGSRPGEAITLDLTEATFIDSQFIGVLMMGFRNNLEITVRGAAGIVRRALELAGVDSILSIDA